MNWKVKVEITLKQGILDPQGAAVENALASLEYNNVNQVRVGKYLELHLNGLLKEEARQQVEEMCHRLLTNPVIEDYKYTLEELS